MGGGGRSTWRGGKGGWAPIARANAIVEHDAATYCTVSALHVREHASSHRNDVPSDVQSIQIETVDVYFGTDLCVGSDC